MAASSELVEHEYAGVEQVDEHVAYWSKQTDGTRVIAEDRHLEGWQDALRYRYARYLEMKKAIEDNEGGLDQFSMGYKKLGFNKQGDGVVYREWAPAAKEMYLTGDFNGWNRRSHGMSKDGFGVWEIFLPEGIPHSTRVKTVIITHGGMSLDRNPAYGTFFMQNPETVLYDCVYWNPAPEWTYQWEHPAHVEIPDSMRIYECHVGMGSNDPKVGSYREFADNVVPHIARTGYTAVQFMAIMEHSYYASFGYHVTNFFGASSRSGTPEDLKYLVDTCHKYKLQVLMDVVHSHSSSNAMDGLSMFDGTDHLYFHGGAAGYHSMWDSRCFDYGKWEVMRFLLSNLRFWIEEYHFDGFRFDGVTSMLYKHHGIGYCFTGDYNEYFGYHVDVEACVYMMLANEMVHTLYPKVVVTIAEDVSGMPTLCRPVEEGGLGFDYRLAMSIPDKWIQILETKSDWDWDMGDITHTLTNRRWNEKTIGYCESHDQALVGDKTLAMWLMNAEMYYNMGTERWPTPVVERGLALHKMMRLVTFCLGGEGYLTFMGNEFGHPEWIDFPREGNGWSYTHARRRWDLAFSKDHRYKFLLEWERLMYEAETKYPFCRPNMHQWVVLNRNDDKVIVVERGKRLLLVFNFHPCKSYSDYRIGTYWPGKYKCVLDSDAWSVDGQGRVHWDVIHQTSPQPWNNRPHSLQLFMPARTCQMYYCFQMEGEVADDEPDMGVQVAPVGGPEKPIGTVDETLATGAKTGTTPAAAPAVNGVHEPAKSETGKEAKSVAGGKDAKASAATKAPKK
ncbi:1,4-alpha-glucan-branching enzyme 2-1, chloroplastic/amyloplastic [Porphyridium purpureum]|uniref:1,4-alpha-glucan branching enzyme n=1 Tax=Porphyridium purpureum TaxID=35688 RepID=A0A5J4Z2U1_PORPP|nr:1,4-alpha-glucan-branching enzyme 2-1, chloroplastic/amyloplastic [Porphyridium purpureum]|eukprot:POR5380..scf208_2